MFAVLKLSGTTMKMKMKMDSYITVSVEKLPTPFTSCIAMEIHCKLGF